MIGKILAVVLGLAKGFFLAVGMIVVALVWWLSSGSGSAKSDSGVKNQAVEVQAVEAQKDGASESCACGAGVCVGQRGGRYCVRPDGSKKYVATPGQ